jgi:hypothetical protein
VPMNHASSVTAESYLSSIESGSLIITNRPMDIVPASGAWW